MVRSTLHLDAASEEEALRAFRADFNESLRNAWTISLDWWFHMMNQRKAKDDPPAAVPAAANAASTEVRVGSDHKKMDLDQRLRSASLI